MEHDGGPSDQVLPYESVNVRLIWAQGVEHTTQISHGVLEGQSWQRTGVRQHVESESPHDLDVALKGLQERYYICVVVEHQPVSQRLHALAVPDLLNGCVVRSTPYFTLCVEKPHLTNCIYDCICWLLLGWHPLCGEVCMLYENWPWVRITSYLSIFFSWIYRFHLWCSPTVR